MKSKPLKIIIFDGSFKTTTFINRLALGLSKNHEVTILGFNNTVKKKLPNVHYIDLGSSQKVFNLVLQSKLIAARLLFKSGSFKFFFKTIKNIITLNKKQLQQDNFNSVLQLINPDIIHVQWPSLISWCEEGLLSGKYNFVLSQRGYQSNVRPFVDQENYKYLQKWYPMFAGFHSVSKAISLEGDNIHPPQSPTSASSVHRFKGGIQKIDKVVYSGFDFDKLPFSETYLKTNTLQLFSVGRPHWIKGYTDALKACRILKEKQIEFNYTIVGTSERSEELLYLIDDFGLQEHITLLPKMTQEEVYTLMQESSILLFPSIMEGLPNVVVEAMALGLPVISTKCGGVEELITPLKSPQGDSSKIKTGWLVPTRNPEAIVAAIIDFTKTPDSKIEEIRFAARKKVEEQHSEEKMISDMEELYFEVSCLCDRGTREAIS